MSEGSDGKNKWIDEIRFDIKHKGENKYETLVPGIILELNTLMVKWNRIQTQPMTIKFKEALFPINNNGEFIVFSDNIRNRDKNIKIPFKEYNHSSNTRCFLLSFIRKLYHETKTINVIKNTRQKY
ncbi:hypothetical protein [Xenorhabdus sp. PB62.4]|uniref:hypothetical protein n=1 Tax=Xenorhabdus sp. PB62.4 TaxID=1851573 RepID=UPI001656F50C|nr:hypothetical protein [Xenorhabdus sp. PB62.4]MBC8951424.1 hypothetical protein [Xenorhabdus sp. PB62.4]